jgi:apolipoprotein N-acyltransferase
MFDAYGQSDETLPLGVAGSLDARLPRSIGTTPYARHGDEMLLLLGAGLLLLLLVSRANCHVS